MGRELKRVSLDFDWPLNEPWVGFINPYRGIKCPYCKGTGYCDEARKIRNGFYRHMGETDDCWLYELTQEEVNKLHEGNWIKTEEPPSAEDFNDKQKRKQMTLMGLDATARWMLVKHRFSGTEEEIGCNKCDGAGELYLNEEIKEKAEEKFYEKEKRDPPEGNGWQVWETVSEGSPVTPVFETAEELINYLYSEKGWSQEAAENFVKESKWSPSIIMDKNGVKKGHEAIAESDSSD